MKIVAVIPARAGSKGIPNKNIRLVHGQPLVSYAIKNAKASKYITDIVVSTDSAAIQIIASQLQVKCKQRSPELCKDDVTLDSVIFDAIKDVDCDYVVTMQPTSPTLSVKTLDEAIKHAIDNNFDTVISVVNNPHLSWRIDKGKAVPNYTKRLNRQYLPAHYEETGAFVISKRSVVTEDTRIGKAIGVYPVSDDESIDVDNFYDLKLVDFIMSKQKVAIYVNGNNKRGLGHIYRALEIADEFYVKPDIFYDINQTDPKYFGETTHNLVPLNGFGELLQRVSKGHYSLIINDVLSTSIDYMIALRQAAGNAKIVNFEDDGEGNTQADVVFNALMRKDEQKNIRAGFEYYISPKTFMFYEPITIKEKVKNIFISFGGADPQNYSDRLLRIISNKKYHQYHFTVVLGRAKQNVEKLMALSNDYIDVFYDVHNMPELMSKCDIALTSRGRTGYELCMLGIPTIAMAQNKREEKHGFVSNENGFSYLGLNPSDYVISSSLDMYIGMSQHDRQEYQNKLLSHNLRNGRQRVMGIINNL